MFKYILNWIGEHPLLAVILIFVIGEMLICLVDAIKH